jgi:hypothetical protein
MQYRREIGFAFVVADRAIVFDELRDMRLVKSGVVAGNRTVRPVAPT